MSSKSNGMKPDFHPEYERTLKLWDRSDDVIHLQNDLIEYGESVDADGIFGPKTREAVMRVQTANNLVTDGLVGKKTFAALHREETASRLLKHSDLVSAAHHLDVPLAAIMAVNTVESRGSGFFDNGLPAILYERHVMYRRLKTYGLDVSDLRTRYPYLVNPNWGGYIGGPKEHSRLNRAKRIHDVAALESASWGAFQIMGFHWKRLGYRDVFQFVDLMHLNEGNHLDAFVRFIEADSKLHPALKNQDWATFARIYNGPAYAKNAYDVKMSEAFEQYRSDGNLVA